MKLLSIRNSKSRGYITISLLGDGGERESFTVRESEHRALGEPLSGDKIDTDTYLGLKSADERYRARRAALRILAYSDNSERTLSDKLRSRGISRECAMEISREMVSYGYLDEARQLSRLIISEERERKLSRASLTARLMKKGYSRERIDIAIDELILSGEVDFDSVRATLVRELSEKGLDAPEIRKALYKRGFGFSDFED